MSWLAHLAAGIPSAWLVLVVAVVVFAEDAVFVGFVVPGETAAVLGGVFVSLGREPLSGMAVAVVLAAVLGDSVGYEIGRRAGDRVLGWGPLARHRAGLDAARALLAERGGAAVFLGRFVAFFRAVMPALAGMARMPYRRFLVWNAVGGVVWGVGFVLVGYLAGRSYAAVARAVGGWSAAVVGVLVVAALVTWRVRRRRGGRILREGTPASHSS